jgi:glutathione S-transferase
MKHTFPLGRLPVLSAVTDSSNLKQLAQSGSIVRYLAAQLNLAGKDAEEAAKVRLTLVARWALLGLISLCLTG